VFAHRDWDVSELTQGSEIYPHDLGNLGNIFPDSEEIGKLDPGYFRDLKPKSLQKVTVFKNGSVAFHFTFKNLLEAKHTNSCISCLRELSLQ
jgi:hypothetical protein